MPFNVNKEWVQLEKLICQAIHVYTPEILFFVFFAACNDRYYEGMDGTKQNTINYNGFLVSSLFT